VGFSHVRADAHGGTLTRWATLALALFCLFVAGEEISWGQRLFGFRPPNYFLEQNYQQEANLHNLLKNVLDTRYMVMAVALLYGVLAPFLAEVTRLPATLAAHPVLSPWFACVAWLEFSYPFELAGEFAELLLGLLFLLDMVARAGSTSAKALPFRALRLEAAAVVGGLLLVPLNDGLTRWNADTYVAAAREDLNTLEARLARGDLLRPKLLGKRRVHKRVYTAVQAGYLALDEKHYYLDPWNNPYWIAYTRATEGSPAKLVLYSFGPNRRRDTQLGEEDDFVDVALEGDDVGLVISLPRGAQARR
jgi:hypothetical protein